MEHATAPLSGKPLRAGSPLGAWLRLCRPWNGVCAAAMVAASARRRDGLVEAAPATLAALCVAAAAFNYASNIWNDLCDVAADRVNKPDRPLVTGVVDARAALALSVALFAAWVLLHLFAASSALPIVAGLSALSIAYSAWLKRTVLAGNLAIAAVSSLSILWVPLIARGALRPVLLPAIDVFLFVLAQEILKTAEDAAGDARAGMRTLATAIGVTRTLGVFAAVALLAAIGVVATVALAPMSRAGAALLLLALPALAISVREARRSAALPSIRRAVRLTRAALVVGVLAFLLR